MYSEFLTQVQSQPQVWEAVKHTQKGLPQDVFESIQAMFSDEKEDFFESVDFFESIEAMLSSLGLALSEKALIHRMS